MALSVKGDHRTINYVIHPIANYHPEVLKSAVPQLSWKCLQNLFIRISLQRKSIHNVSRKRYERNSHHVNSIGTHFNYSSCNTGQLKVFTLWPCWWNIICDFKLSHLQNLYIKRCQYTGYYRLYMTLYMEYPYLIKFCLAYPTIHASH